jgi:alkylhydroperoxidase/carboxymuconolactone decarboxylase family protein YurZ
VSVFDEKAARLARLFTAICLGDFDEVRAIRRDAPTNEPDRAWREAVLQTHLFCGFPRLVQAYGVFDAEGGLGDPDPDEYELEADTSARGAVLFDEIYASAADKMRARLDEFRPDFSTWVLEHAYGRVLSRPGLDPALRELLSICALAALDQPAQFESHARGALRLGATHDDLINALEATISIAPKLNIDRARTAVAKLSRQER